MSAVIHCRSRICSLIYKNNRRFFSAETAKKPITSSSTVLKDQQPPHPPPPAAGAEKKPFSFLKYGLLAAVTGGVATAGYATYAYTLDDEKTNERIKKAIINIDSASSGGDDIEEQTQRFYVVLEGRLLMIEGVIMCPWCFIKRSYYTIPKILKHAEGCARNPLWDKCGRAKHAALALHIKKYYIAPPPPAAP